MTNAALLITIDTEGDNVWSRPDSVTTCNASFLSRFHKLCTRHGFRPTYLTNYEMARCSTMADFGRALLRDESGEIGMHLHAWDTPPLVPLTDDDHNHHPPLIAFPTEMISAKILTMTELIGETFGVAPRSHRAGRWGFDGCYARALVEAGYVADCSVTPHIFWRYRGLGGARETVVDYRRAPEHAYYLAPEDVCCIGNLPLMELPMTVARRDPQVLRPLRDRLPPLSIPARGLARVVPPYHWLRPRLGNLEDMKRLLDEVVHLRRPYAQMILHSSELMPGGSPYFPNSLDVEQLYDDLEVLFKYAAPRFSGSTVGEMADLLASAGIVSEASNVPEDHSQRNQP